MTAPEPSYPPLSTREIGTLPEGARVIETWSEGNARHSSDEHEHQTREGDQETEGDEDLADVVHWRDREPDSDRG